MGEVGKGKRGIATSGGAWKDGDGNEGISKKAKVSVITLSKYE